MTAPAAKAGPDQGPATPAFGVYVHWPFCESKCPYCDFNSHVAETVDQARWARALVSDLAHYAEDTSERTVTTVFFGGGTPSLMRPETVATVIDGIKGLWTTAPDMEISLEANPSSAEIAAFPDLKAAGVTRLSVGVQSFSDDALAGLGRRHDATAARRPAGDDFLVRAADVRTRRREGGEGLPGDRTRRVAVGKRYTPGATLGDDGLQGPAPGGVAEAATSE